jgi:hypothetical protein
MQLYRRGAAMVALYFVTSTAFLLVENLRTVRYRDNDR